MGEGPHIDIALKQWATPRQLEFVDAINETGSVRAAAKKFGLNHSTVQESIARLKIAAAKAGYSPDHDMKRPVPDGFLVKGVSTYYNSDGVAAGQWVKSSVDAERQKELFQAAVDAMAAEIPRLAPLAKPEQTLSDLLTLHTFTDCHVGMLAWHRETGSDWDLSIAEKTLVGCFEHSIAASPRSHTAIINQLGDFLHYDSLQAVTPTHGHILDADGRFSKMVGAAIRILRRIVDLALQHHEHVHVVMAEGNHDMASAVWLRHMFAALYENEPRVTVNDSELPYYVHQWGATLLGFHHGHISKNASLPLLFAAQYPVIWGTTNKRYIHTGHRHHKDEKEHSGAEVFQHPTLAGRDAHAARGGWIAERASHSITYHKRFGEVGRVTITPEMIAA